MSKSSFHISRNLRYLSSTSSSPSIFSYFSRNLRILPLNSSHTTGIVSTVNSPGSSTISSTIPSSYKSPAVSFITSAASGARLPSFHRILANPSGDRME